MTITDSDPTVFVGIDTHADVHHAAVVDPVGRALADRAFPTTSRGYSGLAEWCGGLGVLAAVAVEGTSSYGTALTSQLRTAGLHVVEADRPDRRSRRLHGKTDTLDAYSAARAVAAGRATAVPKAKNGLVEWSPSGVCTWLAAPRSKPAPRRSTRSAAC